MFFSYFCFDIIDVSFLSIFPEGQGPKTHQKETKVHSAIGTLDSTKVTHNEFWKSIISLTKLMLRKGNFNTKMDYILY